MDLAFKAVVPGTVGLLHTENMICINKTTASDPVTHQHTHTNTHTHTHNANFIFLLIYSLYIVRVCLYRQMFEHAVHVCETPNTGPPGTSRCMSSFAYATQLSDDWSAG